MGLCPDRPQSDRNSAPLEEKPSLLIEKPDYYHMFVAYNPAMLLAATIEKLQKEPAVVIFSGPLTLETSLRS
jgi:hypothetical protein